MEVCHSIVSLVLSLSRSARSRLGGLPLAAHGGARWSPPLVPRGPAAGACGRPRGHSPAPCSSPAWISWPRGAGVRCSMPVCVPVCRRTPRRLWPRIARQLAASRCPLLVGCCVGADAAVLASVRGAVSDAFGADQNGHVPSSSRPFDREVDGHSGLACTPIGVTASVTRS